MATVYRAVDLTLQREVAIKILHPHLAKDADLTARFYQEAAIAARIDHPNVMKIYDYGTHVDKRTYIVAELIRGRDFHKLQVEHSRTHQGEPFSPIVCAMFCEEALKGLAAAHALDVVHRDVKPDNVMISDDGQVKLMDFGIAKNTSTSLTLTGHFLGSPSYASPEQVKGENVDARSDLYSMGIILYEALCNRLPFSGQSAPEVMMKICQGKYTPLRQVRPSIHQGLADVVSKALYVDKERRYRSADAMLKELRAFLVECGVQNSRQGLEEYFNDAQSFLAGHTLPAQRPKLGKAASKVSDAEGESLKDTKRSEPRKAQGASEGVAQGSVPLAGQAGGGLGSAGGDWKDPKAIAEALREQQRNALAYTQNLERHNAENMRAPQGGPHPAQGRPQPPRDFRATVRERSPRAFSRGDAYRDTIRGGPARQESPLPMAFLFVLVPALAIFVAYLAFGRSEKPRTTEPSRPPAAARQEDARPPERQPREPQTERRPNNETEQAPGSATRNTSRAPSRTEPTSPRVQTGAPTQPSSSGLSPSKNTPSVRVQPARPAVAPPPAARRNSAEPPASAPPPSRPRSTSIASSPREAPQRAPQAPSTKQPVQPVAPQASMAQIALQTIPGGVPVYLGSHLLGETSRNGTLKTFDSKPGPHLLRIPAQVLAGTRYEGVTRKVFLDAGKTLALGVITLTPIRSLSVNISGPGVIARINGDPYVLKGKPVVLNLPEGKVDIEARASNGKTLRRTVELRGENFALNASLE